jgi:hypothetical protein
VFYGGVAPGGSGRNIIMDAQDESPGISVFEMVEGTAQFYVET